MNDTRIPLHNTIIYLIGFPGTGKYTIAQELAISNKHDVMRI